MNKLNSIFKKLFVNIDLVIFFVALFLSVAGLSVIYSIGVENSAFFKQIISLSIALVVFFIVSN
jgi:cell division protein FtsW (lipid II flippase)